MNVELDVATWNNMPAGNLNAPLDGFVATELARACIITKEFTPNNTAAPNAGNDGVNEAERTLINSSGINSGRDISGNSAEFWTVRIVTIPYYNNEATASVIGTTGVFQPNTNTITICHQEISDVITSWNAVPGYNIDFQTSLRQNVLHEIGHVLLDDRHTGYGNDASIMTSGVGSDTLVSGPYLKFLDTQIQDIQKFNRAKD